jgi:hypothetical protein
MADLPAALYEPLGDGAYAATGLTRGPWDPGAQHAGPPSALLAHALEAVAGIEDGQVARIAVDILRPVPVAGRLQTQARVVRGGRRVEQLEATLSADGVDVMRARAWRIRAEAVALPEDAVDHAPALPGPEGLVAQDRPAFWTGGEAAYFDALEWRFVHGVFEAPGPSACWTRLRVPLIAGEVLTPLEHLLVMADAASGISSMLDWQRFTFANVDFSVALERPPDTTWLGMDATTRLGRLGAGVCTGVLSDERGRVGVSTQALFVAAR